MNRRSFLSEPVTKFRESGKPPANKYANKAKPTFKAAAAVKGIDPYSGPWGLTQVKHLLNRTMFGCTQAQLSQAKLMTMNDLVSQLLTPTAAPSPPVNNYYNEATDPDVAPGATWVNAPANSLLDGMRTGSLKDWWLGQMLNQGLSIHEKMTLMLQNLVPIQYNAVPLAQSCYRYNILTRSYALGNYKSFIKDVTKDVAMLFYLNGYKNQKNNPDENYGRELQELFTVGKGPDSKYTEADVKAAAKVLTGFSIDQATATYKFYPALHDSTNKQFSAFYNNTVITGRTGAAGENELDDLITMIFSNDEVAKHVVRSIYRWFVYYVIDDEIETAVITPLADLFRTSGYNFSTVLDKLLKSEHFYDAFNSGCIIKNPIDYTLGLMKNFNVTFPDGSDVAKAYYGWRGVNIFNTLLAMDPGDPPNVAGWEAYRVDPVYHEAWINAVTISYRNQMFEIMLQPNGYKYKGVSLKIDYMAFTQTVPNAEDPNLLIQNLVDKMSSENLTAAQVTALKSILLSNQGQDHYWTDAWMNYINNPSNTSYKQIVDSRLYSFYRYFLSLAETQLI